MTALKTYKRKPAPTLKQSGQVGHTGILLGRTLGSPVSGSHSEVITNYIADELQQLENTLTIHGQATTTIEDGVTTIKQNIIDLTTTTGNNTAAITQEATVRSSADFAMASLVTTLTATVTAGDNTNAAAISNELLVRANADSAIASDITSLTATVTTADSANAAAITQEATARADADSALATTVTNLAATVTAGDNTNAAAITQEATARANADSAVATTVTNLAATVTSGDNTNSAAISSEQTARANADTALASDITSLTATVTNNNNTLAAAVSSEATARANADSAAASSINTVSASVTTEANARAAADTSEANTRAAADNTITASVTTEATARAQADGVLQAKYGVKLNSNGYITGFSQNNDGTTGSFKIIADEFKIIDPAASAGTAGTQVFDITNGVVTINGDLIVTGSLSVAGKAIGGSVGAIKGTAGNNVSMSSYAEISQTNFVKTAPQHIAAANHSDGSVSAGDVMGGSPLYSFTFTTYAFSGTKDFIVSTLLDPIGSFSSASSTGFAFAMRATTSASAYTSTSASAYVATKGTSKGGSISSQNYILSDVVSLSGNTQYYIWVFGVMDDVNTTGGARGIRDGQITVAGLNI